MKSFLISFFMFLLMSSNALASFDMTSHRYLMPGDFFNKMIMLFPNADKPQVTMTTIGNSTEQIPRIYSHVRYECLNANPDILGAISPLTGEPQSPTPDMNTVNVLMSCGKKLIDAEMNLLQFLLAESPKLNNDISSDSELARETFQRLFVAYSKIDPIQFYTKQLHSNVDSNNPLLHEHTLNLIHYMLGPDEVIAEFNQAASADAIADVFIQKIKNGKTMTLKDYTVWVLRNLIIREEFLSR